ncbi:MAG: transcriptional regulator [Flavobacterium sp.]|nr:transcriptional regulator [Flavobacterium sp.]
MGKVSVSWEEVKQQLYEEDPKLEEAVKELEPEYEVIKEVIRARLEQNISQKELAKRIGTQQAHISRLESGEYNPSLKFLKRLAKGLGKELHISFK